MPGTHRGSRPADLATLFAALADITRLRLLNLINGREVCVCHFVEILVEAQPKISRHLAYLRKAGLVAARREGKWMHYRITPPADPAVAAILTAALTAFHMNPEMQADRAQLDRACCVPPPALLSTIHEPAASEQRSSAAPQAR